jgi:eukaryotic-like serine/threonine-protein kinase
MHGTAALHESFVKPGDVIAGKYRIVRVIGEGGMGIVAEAVHQTLDQRVAIKFHRPQASASAESVARFVREAKSAAQIKSEHVVRVTDVAVLEGGDPYFVMEYLEGRDLDNLIQSDGPLSIPVALDYTLQVCEALAEAHALGIVHRDLKPANLFLANRADGSVVIKLLDFGISKVLPKGSDIDLSMTKTRALMGSPLYMAPEQMRSTRRVDHRADIWSLGVLVHEMLTGDTPFLGETLPEVCSSIAADAPILLTVRRPDATPELEEVLLRCLEKDPEHRFFDVAEFALALAPLTPPEAARSIERIVRVLHGQVLSIPSPGPSVRPSRLPLRPSTPGGSPSSRANDPNADTQCIEPSDQRRSGVAAKMRLRAASPVPTPSPSAETMATTAPSSGRGAGSPGDKKTILALGAGLALSAAAILLLLARPATSTASVAMRAPSVEPQAASRPPPPEAPPSSSSSPGSTASPPSAPASPDPVPLAGELPAVPVGPSLAPHAAEHPAYTSRPPQVQPKGVHPDAGLAPISNHAAAPSSPPSPSGTAAFGAARD